jgi:hypothetical protein
MSLCVLVPYDNAPMKYFILKNSFRLAALSTLWQYLDAKLELRKVGVQNLRYELKNINTIFRTGYPDIVTDSHFMTVE